MRQLSRQNSQPLQRRPHSKTWWFGLLLALATFPGCGGGGTSSGPPPPPPPTVSVSVAPLNENVLLGKTAQFAAIVTGASDQVVTWSVNGVSGGNSTVGTISAQGLYTAPTDLPAPANVTVTATSAAQPASTGHAQVTVTSDITVGISPNNTTNVELGAQQSFSATLTSAGQPDPTIRWTLSGATCPGACGSVGANGNYTAPQILPSPAAITVTAQSVADPSKKATVNINISSHFTLQLAAPGTVTTSATAVIVATITPVPGSNPSTVIHWSLAGTGCSGNACGTLSSVTTQNAGTNSSTTVDTETANYTAPVVAPAPNSVVITATPLADPTKAAQASILVQPGVGVSITLEHRAGQQSRNDPYPESDSRRTNR